MKTHYIPWYAYLLMQITILLHAYWLPAQFTARANIDLQHSYWSASEFGGGVSLIDYNQDGWLDIYMPGGIHPDRLLQNNGNWAFEDVSHLLPFHTMDVSVAAVADLNNDGCDEILLCSAAKFSSPMLLHNKCDGTFSLLTDFGLLPQERSIMGVSFIDYDSDGLLDVYLSNYIEKPNIVRDTLADGSVIKRFPHLCYKNELYRNLGGFQFEKVTAQYEQEDLGCSFVGVQIPTADGGFGLYSINDFGEDVLPHQLHVYDSEADVFEEAADVFGLDIRMFGMGIDIADFDQDLDLDLYITDIGSNKLLVNEGGYYQDRATAFNLDNTLTDSFHNTVSWTPLFFDVDNDTDLDLLVSNGFINITERYRVTQQDSTAFFENVAGQFRKASKQYQLDFAELNRGAVKGDLDRDGDLDLVIANKVPRSHYDSAYHFYRILENQQNDGNNYLFIDLEGVSNNRDGFGTKVFLHHGGETYLQYHFSAGNHAAFDDQQVHFGLGKSERIDSIVLHWQNGIQERILAPPINANIKIKEGTGTYDRTACMDQTADNYDPLATINSGCIYNTLTHTTTAQSTFDYRISPNPAKDWLYLRPQTEVLEHELSIRIYDALGKLIHQTTGTQPISLANAPKGMLYLAIAYRGVVQFEKILKY
ncbi:MAG: FG-GAP-like repeat-containing protein [Bacteroidota bacterium]